ncbi:MULTISPECIES: pyruvate kinase [unclassified Crossiella]|uniref:pyruvate kinase n=1 Tax=unclassified Crossiella TaxID=2620835 RepID=UPI001FFE8892|nr:MULTISPECIES: pyruvate kinase [unclassified Crossiella]MCK2243305.1 pyruvate kinase [Crossiella sp. S99.2]MCK2254226.1 pyruvate kinase [Crossiella sp. S99.1]
MSRRAKIVCTMGPATGTPEKVRDLVAAGMDVARLNFSHGTHADHKQIYDIVRQASDEAGKAVGIMADLQGPKIRLGRFANGPVEWRTGDRVRITVEDIAGTHDRVSTTYKGLAEDAKPGDRMLVDDGKVGLVVVGVEGQDVVCDVTEGGTVSDNKGISLPGMDVSVPALSEKDIEDLEFALGLRVDFIALSFVRSPADIDLVHQVMDRVGNGRLPVIAKLEKPEAVDNLEAVVLAFDGIMVARGDLGVELPLEHVPVVQKRAVQIARENAKPVIVATQMLDSMIQNSRPTRAEASDVANAVLDGADAVMLSGETSVGRYPIETVETMARIVRYVETETTTDTVPPLTHVPRTKRGVISYAARDIGERLNAKALVAFTQSGDTVRRLARLHTTLPLLAFTPEAEVRSQLSLSWGVETFLVPEVDSTDAMVRQCDHAMLSIGRYSPGDLVVIVAGSPPGTVGSTNLIRVHRLGEEDHA